MRSALRLTPSIPDDCDNKAMAAAVWMVVFIITVLFEVTGVVSSGCPQDVVTSASLCLPARLSTGLLGNLTLVHLHCRQGTFQQSAACLAQVEQRCHDDAERRALLHSYVDVERWRDSWSSLCTNVAMLQKHHSCWTLTSQRTAPCIQQQMVILQQRMMESAAARPPLSSSSSPSSSSFRSSPSSFSSTKVQSLAVEHLKLYCNTSKQILECFQPTLRQLCPLEASRLLEDIYLAFQPPLCDQEVSVSEDDKTDDLGKAVTPNGAQPIMSFGAFATVSTVFVFANF